MAEAAEEEASTAGPSWGPVVAAPPWAGGPPEEQPGRLVGGCDPEERRRLLPGAPSAIPAVDPSTLQDLSAAAAQVASRVDELLRSLHGALQSASSLSVGCIQTYRDGVEGLGEAADAGIRAAYALMARCEELDRAMQPVPALARRLRAVKGALERLEGLCK